uniref:Probable U3 small nucleolar RNA-associated protein 11 n=1 Tax=Parastrongyloides trichosuri TaxID=131310 RepID=A0A0N4ZFC1_PARTI
MIRSQVGKDGVHRDLNMNEILGEDEGGIDKDLAKDLHYVTYKYVNEKKKIEKLKSSLQLAFVSQGINKRIIYQDNSDDEEIKGIVVKGTSNLPSDTMINAETKKNYKLLAERIKKLKDLEVVKQKLELQLNMRKAKKDKVKATIVKKGTPTRAAVVRFPVIRKK